MAFDWHSAPLTRSTVVDATYRSTQNVRRFLAQECGRAVPLDRGFTAWIRDGQPKTLGDVADRWRQQQGAEG